jgi:hypothetical protein
VVLQPSSCKPRCGGPSPSLTPLAAGTLKSENSTRRSVSADAIQWGKGPLLADRGSRRLAANHTLQSHGTHQPRHCASRHVLALPPQLLPDLAHAHRPGSCRRRPVGHAALACTVLPLRLLHPFPLTRVGPVRSPQSHAPCLTRLRGVSAMQPIFAAAHSEAYSTPDAPEPPHGSRPASRVRTCLSLAFSSLHPLKVGASGNPGTVHPVVRAGLTPPRSDLNTQLKSIYDLLSCVTSGTRSRKLLFEP